MLRFIFRDRAGRGLPAVCAVVLGCSGTAASIPESTLGGSPALSGGSTSTGGTSTSAIVGGTSSVATGGTSSTGTAVRSNGCGKAAPSSKAAQLATTVNGTARSYFLAPPSNYNSNTAYPVVFVFHGAGGTGESLRGWFTLEEAATGAALFVYPDGLGGIWDLGNNGADAGLFDQLVTSLGDTWCIDKGATFAVGFSYGGWAATQFARARPTVVRAIASIAGGGPQGGRNTDAAVAAMLIHGTADTSEPISSSISSRTHFIATNGCGSTTAALSPAPCVAYVGCQPGKTVAWCEHAGTHEIPSFAPGAIWEFLMSMR